MILKRWETNEVSLIIASAYCLKKVSRPPSKEKEEPGRSYQLKRWN